MAPFWSAFTEANVKSDIEWMRSSIKKLNYSIAIAAICSLILLSSYQIVLDIWMPSNNRIVPPFNLMLILSFFVLISIWNNIYSFFLNGIGIVKVQVQTSIVGGLINIPLAIFLVKYCQLGLAGIVISMCLSLLIFSYFGPRTTFRYLNRKEIKSI
jgi:Na+-driven multidrug efflux pump